MDEFSDSFETLALSMFQPSDELSTSFEDDFYSPAFGSSDINGIPVDSERWGGDTYGYCVIA
jgi:Fungal mating-type pheromone